MPLVSVIIPLFDKAGTVLRTLRSIAAQTMADFEVLIVDDGSRDDGARVAESFSDPRFRLIRQANAGPGAARNRGLQEATGEFAAFLDADDEWDPRYLEHSIGLLNSPAQPSMVVSGWFDEPGHHQGPVFAGRLTPGTHRLSPQTSPQQLFDWLVMSSPCSTVARRSVIQRYGGFYDRDGCRYGEDAHLWLKVLLNEPFHISLEPMAVFHRNDSALSTNLSYMRPLEPFLTDPENVRSVCPAPLRPLLEQFLAYRAQRTSCLLIYWGQWRRARPLLQAFAPPGAWRLPWYLPSRLAMIGPLAALFAALASFWRQRRGGR